MRLGQVLASVAAVCLFFFLSPAIAEFAALPIDSPAPETSFLALPDSNDRTPPDSQGAVGPNHLMTVLNTSVRVHTKTGALIRTTALSVFWSSLNNPDPFDSRCAYDPAQDRWIILSCANRFATNSALLIGVSQSGDPTGPWHLRRLDNMGGRTNWVDFPKLGFNKNWIVVQAVLRSISNNEFIESQIYAFDKQDLYAGGSARHTKFVRNDIGPTQSPAFTHDLDLDVLYLTSTPVHTGVTREMTLWAIHGPIGSETLSQVHTFQAPEPWATKAPGDENFGPQRGTDQRIHLQDASMQNLIYRNGALWAVHHVFLPAEAPARSAVQWWQITTNAILQFGRIDDPQFSFGYPSIAVNRSNDVLIGYSRFGADQFASANYSFRAASDPPNLLRQDAILKSGEGVYLKTRNTGKNRWGDYSSTIVDPEDDRVFWTIQQYAAAPDGDPAIDGSGRWGTWWGKIPPPPFVDTDSDSLPDDWEIVYRLDRNDPADAAHDSDFDGHSNRDEFRAGTNPRQASSVLRFTEITIQRGRLNLTFESRAGRQYRIEQKDAAGPGEWSMLAELPGDGSPQTLSTAANLNRATAIFRLIVQ